MFALLSITLLAQAACTFALPTSSLIYARASANISTLPPSQDPFYAAPSDVARYSRGDIIRARKLPDTTAVFGPNAGDTYQLLFRTRSVHRKVDTAVTTVIAPKKPAKGNAKIIAIASPEDSPAVDCALSWALYPDSESKETVGGTELSRINAMAALFNGYYVTLPDQEGSKAGWLAYSEGQVVLDSIRAIVNHKETIPNNSGYQAALTGYSGGGHGAAWAGQLASTYGKDISIVALAAGGIPVDLGAALTGLDGTMGAGLAFAGLAGLGNVYPEYNDYLKSIMKPNGTDAIQALRNGSQCLNQLMASLAFKSVRGSVKVNDFMTSPISTKYLDESYLGKHEAAIVNFPVYQTHSQSDEVVIYGPAESYHQSQCSKGGRFVLSNPKTGDHVSTGNKSIPSFFYFIKQAFEGTLKVPGCRETTDYLISFDGPEATTTVGPMVVQLLTAATTKAAKDAQLALESVNSDTLSC